MYVSYDPDARATYVEWEAGPIARTVEVSDLMMVDVDDHGRPLGVEILTLPDKVTQSMVDLLVERFPDLKKLRDMERWTLTPA